MKVREIHCKRWFLPKNLGAITIYPFIFYNTNAESYKEVFEHLQKHEMVHIAQVERLGWFNFYLTYLFGKKDQYEKEAYRKEHNDN